MENSRIERLKKSLYSRNTVDAPAEQRSNINPTGVEAPTSWGAPKSFEYTVDSMSKGRNNSFFNKFLLISAVVFLASLGAAYYMFSGGFNTISPNNLDVKIIAPSLISSGEELPIGLTVINGNKVDLQDVYLIVDYPQGTQAIDSDRALTHDRISLGTIASGSSASNSLRQILFGEKDEQKDFNFTVEYKVKGSNATFSKEKSYSLAIGSSPVLLSVDYPKEVNSGQDMTIKINLTSNSSVTLKNALVKIDYPYGFTYGSSSLKPLRNNSVWNIGDMANGDKKTLEITGVMIGQNQEDKTFKINVGSQSATNVSDIESSLAENDITVGIRKSFFDLGITSGKGVPTKMGGIATANIKWDNTLLEKIVNAKITVTLGGNALDRSRVTPGNNGYYKSIENYVMWDKNGLTDLGSISPGDGGSVFLSMGTVGNQNQNAPIKNPHIDLHVAISGYRGTSDGEEVKSDGDISIKLQSITNFTAKSYRSIGPFANTGPIPPKAETESTYTITWVITNANNDLNSSVVTAKLPESVSWKGVISPSSEKIAYNPDDRSVSWNVGNVSAGSGYSSSARSVSFQIGLVPSLSEVLTTPDLVTDINFSGTDTYAGSRINMPAATVSAQTADPDYKSTDSVVVK